MKNRMSAIDIILIVILVITGILILAGKDGAITDTFKTVITVFLTKHFLIKEAKK